MKRIGLLVILPLALLVALLLSQSRDTHIVRSVVMKAPPDVVFAHVNDLHQWSAWSPWEKGDPAIRRTFSGPAAGVGATYTWAGNSKAGSGRMTIEESQPGRLIKFKLEFLKPFSVTYTAVFMFVPMTDATFVTWELDGDNAQAMHIFFNKDKMIGSRFEQGLTSLKAIAEKEAASHAVEARRVAPPATIVAKTPQPPKTR